MRTTFQAFLADHTQFGLICTIENEELKPAVVLAPSTSSFDNDLSLLPPHIEPKTARYIILRRFDSSTPSPLVAVTYIPDAAPVRQKMLFASTRLTLVRELGSEHFGEAIFATMAEELTKEGFQKHDKHTKLAPPLTEEEASLGEVKRKEAEEGRGAGARQGHQISGGIQMPVSDEALEALQKLSNGQENLVQWVWCLQSHSLMNTVMLTRNRKSICRLKSWN